MNASAPRLKIVVLAAGFSSRLGQPKALARVHGTSLLRRTAGLAAALRPARIVIVVPPACARYRAEALHRTVSWVRNSHRGRGLSSSVRCGLKHAGYCSAVLLLPVDLSELKLRELKGLVSRWRAAPGRVFATRILSRGGIAQGGVAHGGAPLILPARLFARARSIEGDVGLRRLLADLPPAQRVLVDLPSARTDVDTVEDLAAARRRWT
jgi:molybdenum cofactor cytidylyltransferase